MRVLITGGNGFLGSNLVKTFVNKSYEVLVISRNSTSLKDTVTFIQHTSPGYKQFADQIKAFSPTIVIHCAWDGGNTYADVNSIRQVSNIPWGTELVEILTTMPVKPRFVGFGSFSEYGVLTSRATETIVDAPISLYGQTKSCFKSISKLICEKNDIPWIWIRPCYIYGPGDVKTRFIPSMLRKLRTDESIMLDSCTSTIDYLHVDDFCKGIVCILDKSETGIFNVCSGEEYSIRYIIEILQQVTNGKSVLTFDKSRDRTGMSTYTCGSSERLRSLGWTPQFTIQEGILSALNTE